MENLTKEKRVEKAKKVGNELAEKLAIAYTGMSVGILLGGIGTAVGIVIVKGVKKNII